MFYRPTSLTRDSGRYDIKYRRLLIIQFVRSYCAYGCDKLGYDSPQFEKYQGLVSQPKSRSMPQEELHTLEMPRVK
jgi:hypothetical protein